MRKIRLAGLLILVALLAGCVTGIGFDGSPAEEGWEYLGPVRITIGPFARRNMHRKLMEEARNLYGVEVDDVVVSTAFLNWYVLWWVFVVEGKAVSYGD